MSSAFPHIIAFLGLCSQSLGRQTPGPRPQPWVLHWWPTLRALFLKVSSLLQAGCYVQRRVVFDSATLTLLPPNPPLLQVCAFSEALAEGAIKMGMPSGLAHRIAAQTLLVSDGDPRGACGRGWVCLPDVSSEKGDRRPWKSGPTSGGTHDEAGYTVGLSWRRGCPPPSSQ